MYTWLTEVCYTVNIELLICLVTHGNRNKLTAEQQGRLGTKGQGRALEVYSWRPSEQLLLMDSGGEWHLA